MIRENLKETFHNVSIHDTMRTIMKSVLQRVKFVALKPWNKFKSLSFKKKIIVIVLLIVVFVVISQVIGNATKKPGYTLAKVSRSDITEVVSETGNVATNGTINISSPTNGKVENVYVTNGQHVTEGETLFTVESSATEQEAQAAYANYLTATSSLGTAQATMHSLQSGMFGAWDTYKNLAENDTFENSDGTPKNDQRTLPEYHIAEKDWLAAEARYKNQQSVVAQTQAQVSSTWLLYQATQNATVKATTDGTVSNLSITQGSSVNTGTALAPAAPILSISNFATTEVIVLLGEGDIAKIKDGQNADIDVNAASEKVYKGVVRRVDTIGTDNQGVVRYNAYIEVLNPDNMLRPGMNADVDITTNKLSNVLSVPNSAVKPYQGGRAVRIIGKNDEVTYKPVKIGTRGTSKTQILSGIKEGEEVITSLSNEQIQRPGLF